MQLKMKYVNNREIEHWQYQTQYYRTNSTASPRFDKKTKNSSLDPMETEVTKWWL